MADLLDQLPGIFQGPQGVAGTFHEPQPRIRLDSFIDYQCPYCRQFEHRQGPTVQRLVDDGKVEWVLHPVAFLDDLSQGTMYSTRAGGFAFGIAELAAEQFGQYSNYVFWHQPKENTPGLTDEQLVEYAVAVGVPQPAAQAALDQRFQQPVAQATEAAVELGVQGIPTVVITDPTGHYSLWDGQTSFDTMADNFLTATLSGQR
jgi:protein-disulfide isomerase